MSNLLDLVQKRRSIYDVGTNTDVTVDQVVERIRELARDIPNAFGIQTTRFIVVSGEANDKVWDSLHKTQKDVLSDEMYANMKERLESGKNGLGTVLLFESRNAVESMPSKEKRATLYKENNHGIAVMTVWLALTEMGLGTNLQHFNIGYEQGFDKEIREMLDLPDDYEMLAQMYFGSIENPADEKEYMDSDIQVQHIEEI